MNNCCFINCVTKNGLGFGDCLYHIISAIVLSKSYDKIYVKLFDYHYDYFLTLFNILTNNINNVFLVNYKLSQDFELYNYFNIFENNEYNYNNKIIINNNTYINFMLSGCFTQGQQNLYLNFFRKLNIKKNDIANIKINFTNEINELNRVYYNKVIDRVGKDYICIFNCPERFQDLASFKLYKKEFNKNNYPVIYFMSNYNEDNKLLIKDILGDTKDIIYYHDIVANSKEVHFIGSYPSCYFSLICTIIPEYFKNVEKYCYNRYLYLVNNDENRFNINYNNIAEHQLYNFKYIIHQNDFSHDKKYNYLNMKILDHQIYIYNDKINIFNNMLVDIDNNDTLMYFKKNLFNFGYSNRTPITYVNDYIREKNIILIDIDSSKINNINIDNIITNENLYTQLLKYINKNKVNIILIKYYKPFYFIFNEREIDDNFNCISEDNVIQNYDEEYIRFYDKLMNMDIVDYIYCCTNEEDKNYFISLLL